MNWLTWFQQTDPADLFVGFVAAIGLGFTVSSIRRQTRDSRLEKIADVLMDCTRRFENLVSLRYQLEISVAEKKLTVTQAAERYYSVYWNLQFDQFNYCLLGLLPRQILASWMLERLALLQRGEEVLGTSFEDGWERFGRNQMKYYKEFSSFVNKVWALRDETPEQSRAIIDNTLKSYLTKSNEMLGIYR